eukprot:gene19159-25768_t
MASVSVTCFASSTLGASACTSLLGGGLCPRYPALGRSTPNPASPTSTSGRMPVTTHATAMCAPTRRRASRRSRRLTGSSGSDDDDDYHLSGPEGPGSGSGGFGGSGGWSGRGGGLPEDDGMSQKPDPWADSLLLVIFYEVGWMWTALSGLSFAQAIYFIFNGFRKACAS